MVSHKTLGVEEDVLGNVRTILCAARRR